MFEGLIRELGKMHGTHKIAVSLPSDADGYFDRECPSPECLCQFKIHEEDWRDKVRDDQVFCAFCGHEATSDKWWTQEQLKYAKEAAVAQFESRISNAMRTDARRWNSRQPSNALLRITLSVKDGPRHHLLPPAALEPMRLRIDCPECKCRYAAIGAAFFCPACGHNAADLMFQQSINGIRSALNALSGIRAAVPDRDSAETTSRLLLESSLQTLVGAFQRYAEAMFGRFATSEKPRRNAFQNLNEGSVLWEAAAGKSYGNYLDAVEFKTLVRGFQQRHLLAHAEGIVDETYITRSDDVTYRAGQRIVLKEAAVREYLTLIEKLATGMAADSRRSG